MKFFSCSFFLFFLSFFNPSFSMHSPNFRLIDYDIGQKSYESTKTACTAMAICAISYLTQYKIEDINENDLFLIIEMGKQFYTGIKACGFLACDESLIRKFNMGRQPGHQLMPILLGFDDSPYHEGINQKIVDDQKLLSTTNLIYLMEKASREHNHPIGIVWTINNYSYAIIIKDNHFLFFDSHHHYANSNPGSYILIFNDAESIIEKLLTLHPNQRFAVTFLYPDFHLEPTQGILK